MAKAKYTRGKDGYFCTKVWDGTYTADGKKHRVPLRTRTSSAALERMVNDMKAKVEQRELLKKVDLSFYDYAKQYVAIYKATKENNTKNMYENIVEKHLKFLKDVKLQDITRNHYQLCINNAKDMERTQQQIKMVFKQVLQSAVVDHYFSAGVAEEIFRSMDKIKYTPEEKRPLTDYERKAVFDAEFSTQDKIFVHMLYGCGLRRGENLALTVYDFDLSKRTVTINKSHEFSKNDAGKKGPKSGNGFRTVPIPDIIWPEIECYVKSLRASGKVYLYTMRGGKPVSKSSYDKMWARILREMQKVSKEQINGLTAHIFRHNYCTNLCYQIPSISISKIAELLGDTEKMVIEVYNHILLEKEDSAGAVNRALC